MEPRTLDLVKKSFSDYLTRPEWEWSWFMTQTFDFHKCGYRKRNGKLDVHREICEESFQRMMEFIGKTATICYGFGFGELHKSGRPHWHAVVHVGMDLYSQCTRESVWEYMFKMYGRNTIAEVMPCQGLQVHSGTALISDGISRYLTKYVAKESATGQAWWDFKGYMSGSEADPSQIAAITGIRQTS